MLAAAAVLPLPDLVATVAVAVVAVLLAESFLHEAVDRWRAPGGPLVVPYGTVLAFLVVWLALVAPTDRDHLTLTALLRLPLEVLVVVALVAGVVAAAAGLARGGDRAAAGACSCWSRCWTCRSTRSSTATSTRSGTGPTSAPGSGCSATRSAPAGRGSVAVLAGLATLAVLVGVPLAMLRLVKVAAEPSPVLADRGHGVRDRLGALPRDRRPGGERRAGRLDQRGVADRRRGAAGPGRPRGPREFSDEIGTDPYAARAAADPQALLSGLAGKDVLLVFVESYGRVAVQDTSYSDGGRRRSSTRAPSELAAAGYHSQSAFLTSPTFGAGSWLAHSSLQSGLWVDSQRRYRQLLGADRMTLTSLFGQAGWRTVFDVPADTKDWPEGKDFYGFQQYYDSRNVGYEGPKFGYAPMPDQYTLEEFRRRELAPADRPPVMAEIDLVSSHHPWAPLPHMVPWDQVGDGSVFDGMPEQGQTSEEVFSDPEAGQARPTASRSSTPGRRSPRS